MAEIQTDQLYKDIVETIREPLLILDQDLRVILAGRSFYDFFKVTPEETVGKLIYDLGNKQWDIPKLRELLEIILPGNNPFNNYEVEHDFATIGRRTMLLNARQVEQKMGKKRIILLAIEDITEHKRLEVLLADSEERYRRLFETADDGIVLLEKNKGTIAQANPAITKMMGYSNEEFIGNSLNNVGFPDDVSDLQKILQTLEENGILHYIDIQLQNKNGQAVDTDIYMVDKASLIQCNIRDTTERKMADEKTAKLQSQLHQSQKMEAIGTLAGGIAHDFNNILSAILGYTALAISDVPQGSNIRDDLEEVLKAGNRAKDLVSQILTFSRQAETQFFQIQIHLIVKEALKLLRSSLPATIEINENFRAFGKVLADPTQIHQILMNLCTNAFHAMSEDGGELSVSLIRVKAIDELSVPENLPPGPYLKLTVRDTGCGMMPDVISRIFEPYFTTKGLNKGTGLGLSTVQGIVQSHGGLITVESTPGKGSSFHVYLPEITEPVTDSETIEQEKIIFTGTERILVVDDEVPIVKLLKKTLEKLGYEVTGRISGIEALKAQLEKDKATIERLL